MAEFETRSEQVVISRVKRDDSEIAKTYRQKRDALAFELNHDPR